MAMLILVGSHEGPKVYLSWSEGKIPSCSTMSRNMGLVKPEIYLCNYPVME